VRPPGGKVVAGCEAVAGPSECLEVMMSVELFVWL
jgi:hypothetical protein